MIERTVTDSNLFGSVTRAHQAALGGMRKELLLCPIFGVLMVLVGIGVPDTQAVTEGEKNAVGAAITTVGDDTTGGSESAATGGSRGGDAVRLSSPSRTMVRGARSHSESMTAANAMATIVRSGRVNPHFFDNTGVETLPGLTEVDLARLRALATVRAATQFGCLMLDATSLLHKSVMPGVCTATRLHAIALCFTGTNTPQSTSSSYEYCLEYSTRALTHTHVPARTHALHKVVNDAIEAHAAMTPEPVDDDAEDNTCTICYAGECRDAPPRSVWCTSRAHSTKRVVILV